ncbi:5-formyltetrahydrofolate cyclo-ligase [Alteromonas sp. ASW11-36]|uniref:5-formyltetrahydrofolate cyclo-ligase n=1 Tax=Alteromonas arenosi TaxID=3055817 RepID=A0ABT7STP9_9ALTE|nr:5-formyltetrahydrofolate cyclo-ligase [Alteromonas sp. ASW11-36]MDM7859563.1 5-formyltetrahydrofolate cyclo-ligase [Alteromonas sp. ASW11-36]
MSTPTSEKKALRHHYRALRRGLTAQQQQSASDALLTHVATYLDKVNPSVVSGYLANDGEIDIAPILALCWQRDITTVLPIVDPNNTRQLVFARYDSSTQLRDNTYGIPEPVFNQNGLVPLADISHILLPLVAFNLHGHRLGMGGGYYDTTLSSNPHTAKLIGVAHDIQLCEDIPIEPWDVPLAGIFTPSGFSSF